VSYLKNLVRKLSFWALTSGVWLSLATMTLAKGKPVPTAPSTGSSGGGNGAYVFPYFLVVVLVAVGMAIVCNPSRRREKAKPDDYSEKKLV
jgi:hypothetical protein